VVHQSMESLGKPLWSSTAL